MRSYTYHASDLDSKVSARAAALGQVRHMLLSEIGTYVDSKITIKESSGGTKISKHDITAIAMGIVQTEILKETWNGTQYFTEVKLIADPDEIVKKLETQYKLTSIGQESSSLQKRAYPLKTASKPNSTSTHISSSGRKIALLARHGLSPRNDYEDRDVLTSLVLKNLQTEVNKIISDKTEVTPIADFDITRELLGETEKGLQSRYMCYLYDADLMIAAILEDWEQGIHSSGANHTREMSLIIYNCKQEEIDRFVFQPKYSPEGEYAREKSIRKEFRRFLKEHVSDLT